MLFQGDLHSFDVRAHLYTSGALFSLKSNDGSNLKRLKYKS